MHAATIIRNTKHARIDRPISKGTLPLDELSLLLLSPPSLPPPPAFVVGAILGDAVVGLGVGARVGVWVGGGPSVHSVCPSSCVVLTEGQARHDVAGEFTPYCPLGQGRQADAPEEAPYCPLGQGVHTLAPVVARL